MAAAGNMEFATSGSMMALAICFLIICTILVLLRGAIRRIQKQAFGADDAFILFSWLSLIAMCVNTIVAVSSGAWGQPAQLVVLQRGKAEINPLFFQAEEFYLIQEVVFAAQVAFTKLSILFLYRRVLCPENRGWLHWSTLGLIIVTSLWGATMFFVYLFQCGAPVSNYWANPSQVKVTCLHITIEWFMTISDFVLDVIIFFLPIYRLAQLHLPLGRKITVIGIFALGAVSVAASLLRGAIYLPLMKELTTQHSKDSNPFMITSSIAWWFLFESGFGLVTVCLPSLKYIFDKTVLNISSRYGSLNSSRRSFSNKKVDSTSTSTSAGRHSHSSQSSRDLEKGYFVTTVTSGR